VVDGERLGEDDAAALVGAIVDGEIGPTLAAGILIALASRREALDEVAGAARAMRARATAVEHGLPLVLDVVGTGGDGAGTINLSTMAALVVAAAGVPVAKHGNRAASSVCGSADVLEAAGFPLDASPERCARMLRATNFTFLFAPQYHPAMRRIGPVRRELGVPTIFNYLGPLTNPASPTHAVVGVARAESAEMVAQVLSRLGVRGVVVHGAGGMDEVSGEGISRVVEFAEELRAFEIDPARLGVYAPLRALAGATREACVEAFFAILGGERSPRSDAVALNAALAMTVAGIEARLETGLERARALLHAGEPLRVFRRACAIE
jgi:anthranilate phosphoribosyltransferase